MHQQALNGNTYLIPQNQLCKQTSKVLKSHHLIYLLSHLDPIVFFGAQSRSYYFFFQLRLTIC